MNEYQLQIDQVYFCEHQGRMMKYIGTQTFQGKVYHNFYEPVMRLFHWLDPQDVSLPNIACSGQVAGVGNADGESQPSATCH